MLVKEITDMYATRFKNILVYSISRQIYNIYFAKKLLKTSERSRLHIYLKYKKHIYLI